MKYLKKILDLLTPNERQQAALLLCMILMMAFLDVLGVASILPFMAFLANPELVETNRLLNAVYIQFGFKAPQNFLFALGVLVFVFLVFSLSFKALTLYLQLRFALMREYSIGKRLVEGYLHQPYSWFLNRHSADLGKNILSEVNNVVGNGVMPTMSLITQGAVAVALLILLIFINPQLATIVGLTLASSCIIIFKLMRGYLNRVGQESIKANKERFTVLSEIFGATKEVKVSGLERVFIERFAGPAQKYASHQATAQVISQLPRFALEVIAFGGLLLAILYLMVDSGSFANALPVISLYAYAGYRLMPALQQIYAAATQLRFADSALNNLHADLMSLKSVNSDSDRDTIDLKRVISLNNIQYCYPNAPNPALRNLNLIIPAKSTVGLVGTTGSGKTTTVDLILGLLEAQQGTLEVDGQTITELNRKSWQRAIGYVPQQIYLSDDTVAANIAFGIDSQDIDHAAVERAAKIANLHNFVSSELLQQYQTTVGERGVRLSGGQRQRIGIARALYHNPQVLILDEATSALDSLTEQAVMESLYNLERGITIILIAHRLSTVKACDAIFLLEKGELKAQGTFDELINTNQHFRAMAMKH